MPPACGGLGIQLGMPSAGSRPAANTNGAASRLIESRFKHSVRPQACFPVATQPLAPMSSPKIQAVPTRLRAGDRYRAANTNGAASRLIESRFKHSVRPQACFPVATQSLGPPCLRPKSRQCPPDFALVTDTERLTQMAPLRGSLNRSSSTHPFANGGRKDGAPTEKVHRTEDKKISRSTARLKTVPFQNIPQRSFLADC